MEGDKPLNKTCCICLFKYFKYLDIWYADPKLNSCSKPWTYYRWTRLNIWPITPFPFSLHATLLPEHSRAPCFWKVLIPVAHLAIGLGLCPWRRLRVQPPITLSLLLPPQPQPLFILQVFKPKTSSMALLPHTKYQCAPESHQLGQAHLRGLPLFSAPPLKNILLLWQPSALSCQYPIFFPVPCHRQRWTTE